MPSPPGLSPLLLRHLEGCDFWLSGQVALLPAAAFQLLYPSLALLSPLDRANLSGSPFIPTCLPPRPAGFSATTGLSSASASPGRAARELAPLVTAPGSKEVMPEPRRLTYPVWSWVGAIPLPPSDPGAWLQTLILSLAAFPLCCKQRGTLLLSASPALCICTSTSTLSLLVQVVQTLGWHRTKN